MPAGGCQHCKKQRPIVRRGLCGTCYLNTEIRFQYPVLPSTRRGSGLKRRPSRIECWACGCEGPHPGKNWAERSGWSAREIVLDSIGTPVMETYCGQCMEEWGWPDEWLAKHEQESN